MIESIKSDDSFRVHQQSTKRTFNSLEERKGYKTISWTALIRLLTINNPLIKVLRACIPVTITSTFYTRKILFVILL